MTMNQTTSSKVTVFCDACDTEFRTDKWSANHGLTMCNDCCELMAEAQDDTFESALWAKAGRNER